jgi:hypothetical protein
VRILVAGHDLGFLTGMQAHLAVLPGTELRVDEWTGLRRHDDARSRDFASWADVIVCEWCGPNAVWYSARKRGDQRLIVRLHRFELFTPYPKAVRIEAVDLLVCVSAHFTDVTREMTCWPAD